MTPVSRRHLLALALAVCCIGVSFSQEVLLPRAYESTDVGVVYDRELSFPVTLHTNGFHVGVNFGQLKTYYQTTYWGFNIGQLKHPREKKQSEAGSSFGQGLDNFVYGKQNSLLTLRVVKGWRRYYSGKDHRRGVAVGTAFEVGATAGILKPYVLQIANPGGEPLPPDQRYVIYSKSTRDRFLNRDLIEGTGGLKRGWSDASVVPGVNAKAAVHLDWGAFDEFMRGLEAGVMVDVFPTRMKILVDEAENTPLFLNFYVAAHLGKRR